jgi:hypothetical protein
LRKEVDAMDMKVEKFPKHIKRMLELRKIKIPKTENMSASLAMATWSKDEKDSKSNSAYQS